MQRLRLSDRQIPRVYLKVLDSYYSSFSISYVANLTRN